MTKQTVSIHGDDSHSGTVSFHLSSVTAEFILYIQNSRLKFGEFNPNNPVEAQVSFTLQEAIEFAEMILREIRDNTANPDY